MWAERVKQAIGYAETVDELQYIEEKIYHSPKRPDYRSAQGRQIRDTLLSLKDEKHRELANNNPPF